MANLTKQQAIERLELQILAIDFLKGEPRFSPAFKAWLRDTEVVITHIFGTVSRHNQDFTNIRYSFPLRSTRHGPEEHKARYVQGLEEARAILESMVREIQHFWPDTNVADTAPALVGQDDSNPATRDVFIVHGHDDGLKETVARFLSDLNLKPIILHERPNQGRTIIDKFKDHASVAGFAVALFTPDDLGEAKDKVTTVEDLRPRARQNVIFELGFFVGKLPRGNAVALVKGDIELPSDLAGVLYIPVDNAGRWRFDLIRELKAAGFAVDANLVV